jgi:biotin synthase
LEKRIIIRDILNKCLDGGIPTREEAIALVQVELDSEEFYSLCYVANKLSREHFGNKGDVVAQIGLDYAPCSRNCGFCSFGRDAGVVKERLEWDADTVVKAALAMVEAGANGIYLMTTADYPYKKFIAIAAAVREAVQDDIPLIANIGDFNYEQAQKLKEVGFSAVYHALRLREGTDTGIPRTKREETIANARAAGLAVQVCLEPVGPEHTPEEMVEQMFWAREIGATFNGAMKRTAVPGTRLAGLGEISFRELARLIAVTRLVMGDRATAHCTHEPNLPALMAGANLIWAEAGPNPRDVLPDTAAGRGQSVRKCQEILFEAGYDLRQGATPSAYPAG